MRLAIFIPFFQKITKFTKIPTLTFFAYLSLPAMPYARRMYGPVPSAHCIYLGAINIQFLNQ